MDTTTLERPALDITDRCDRCGAQAFIRAIFSHGELTFCGHHGRQIREGLEKQALLVQDATDQINAQPSPSANSD